MKNYRFMMPKNDKYKFATFEERLAKLQEMLDNAKHVVFFGGAGVSTESGIPDFRSKDGLYNQRDVQFDKYKPEYLLSRDCLYNNPKVFYEFYRQKLDCRNVEPNVTHFYLAELEASGKDVTVVTQNIDGLHQKAGSKNVLEVHGTTYRNYCHHCGAMFDKDYLFDFLNNNEGKLPECPECNRGYVRPDVTLYGEHLPVAMDDAFKSLEDADLLVVAGTSLTVYPAADLVKWCECPVVIVNRDETEYDDKAMLLFKEELGEVFGKLKVRDNYEKEL